MHTSKQGITVIRAVLKPKIKSFLEFYQSKQFYVLSKKKAVLNRF